MTPLTVQLRAATAHDQRLIHAWARRAKLNPLGLAWRNFMVAERMDVEPPRVVGIGQVRRHRDGTQELASLVVDEAVRGQGVGSRLVRALIDQTQLPLYLICNRDKVPYYERFGFVEVRQAAAVPRALRGYYQLGRVVARVARLFEREPSRLAIMVCSS
jgi:N-acetylglutamate synthase-like GNAT family acetyltransferase